jgi:hypothetical protein
MTTSSLGTPFLQDAPYPGPAAGASGILSGAESSGHVLEPLREGPDFTLYRGRQHGKPIAHPGSGTNQGTTVASKSQAVGARVLTRRRTRSHLGSPASGSQSSRRANYPPPFASPTSRSYMSFRTLFIAATQANSWS